MRNSNKRIHPKDKARINQRVKAKAIRVDEALQKIAPLMVGIFAVIVMMLIYSNTAKANEFRDLSKFKPLYPKTSLTREEIRCQFSKMRDTPKNCGQDRAATIRVVRNLQTFAWFNQQGPRVRLGSEKNLSIRDIAFLSFATTWPEEDLLVALHLNEDFGIEDDTEDRSEQLRGILDANGIDRSLFLEYASACQSGGSERFPIEVCPSQKMLGSEEVQNLAAAQRYSRIPEIANLFEKPLGRRPPGVCYSKASFTESVRALCFAASTSLPALRSELGSLPPKFVNRAEFEEFLKSKVGNGSEGSLDAQ